MEGTNREQAAEIIASSDLPIEKADTLLHAVDVLWNMEKEA